MSAWAVDSEVLENLVEANLKNPERVKSEAIDSTPQEIRPGIWLCRIPVPFVLGSVNVYLVETKAGPFLIDCGANTPQTEERLENALSKTGYCFEDLSLILITHHHLDHSGLLSAVQARSGARTAMHITESACIESFWDRQEATAQEFWSFLKENGMPDAELGPAHANLVELLKLGGPAIVDDKLLDGAGLGLDGMSLQTLCTPGHSPKHLCLYDPARKVFFSGDHLLPRITSHVGFGPYSSSNPLADYLEALRKTASLEIDLVLPGHGNPFTHSGERVQQILIHHRDRLERILANTVKDGETVYQIESRIFGSDLPMHEKRLALLETWAHTEWLVHANLLKREHKENVQVYHRDGGSTLNRSLFEL